MTCSVSKTVNKLPNNLDLKNPLPAMIYKKWEVSTTLLDIAEEKL